MLYVLYGPDTFRSREKLKDIVAEYEKAHTSGLNFVRLDLTYETFADFERAAETLSMFSEKKLVVLEHPFQNKQFLESFPRYCKISNLGARKDVIVIVFLEGVAEKGEKSFLKKIEKRAKTQEFSLLVGPELERWFAEHAKKKNISVSRVAQKELRARVGPDTWALDRELSKLGAYCGTKEISEKAVAELVPARFEENVFGLLDAFSARNKKEAFKKLHEHLNAGAAELYLLSMLAFQVRNILMVKDLIDTRHASLEVIKKTLKLHPYVVKKSYFQAKRFSMKELKNIYSKIQEADVLIKRGKRDPRLALEMVALSV